METTEDNERMAALYAGAIRKACAELAEDCITFGDVDYSWKSLERLERVVGYVGHRRFRERMHQLKLPDN